MQLIDSLNESHITEALIGNSAYSISRFRVLSVPMPPCRLRDSDIGIPERNKFLCRNCAHATTAAIQNDPCIFIRWQLRQIFRRTDLAVGNGQVCIGNVSCERSMHIDKDKIRVLQHRVQIDRSDVFIGTVNGCNLFARNLFDAALAGGQCHKQKQGYEEYLFHGIFQPTQDR